MEQTVLRGPVFLTGPAVRGWQTGDFGCWWLLSPEPCLMPPFVPQVKWMMYWIVFAFFTTAETLTDIILSW